LISDFHREFWGVSMELFSFIFLLSTMLQMSLCIKFELHPMIEKCFHDEIRPKSLVSGTVEVTPILEDSQLKIKITDSMSNVVFGNKVISTSKFAFTTRENNGEDYTFCFFDNVKENDSVKKRFVRLEVYSDLQDYTGLATRENLKPLEIQLRKMEDTVSNIVQEYNYIKKREEEHRNTNESTNTRVFFLSILSLTTCVLLGAGQALYMKKYFKSRKMI